MNKLKKIGIVAGSVLILTGTAFAMSPSDFALRQQMLDFARIWPNLVYQYYPDVPQDQNARLGSVTNTEVLQNNFAVGGVREWSERKPLNSQASTTCAFRLNTASTSMLVSASAVIASSSPGGIFEIGYHPLSAFSTSTLIAHKTITAGATDAIISTSTSAEGLGNLTPPMVLQPGGFIVMKYDGSTVNGFCEYKVREL